MSDNASSSNDQAAGLSRITGMSYGSTGAPGSSNADGSPNALVKATDGTGAPNSSGGANTGDFSPQPAYSLTERITNIVDQSGMPHNGVAAAEVYGAPLAAGTETVTDTGASSSAHVGHDHGGAN